MQAVFRKMVVARTFASVHGFYATAPGKANERTESWSIMKKPCDVASHHDDPIDLPLLKL